ncbi:SIMPL domain-containing protein [Massilia sp. PWRC2]|uniref:SIMPL domain-containing protein n=1 Tax=Massilia sp. PWRC2 TaxID=2804626 RepID=UPI003CF03E5F
MSSAIVLRCAVAAAVLVFACRAGAAEFPDYPFIHTSGSGVVYVPPDLGEIDVEIVLADADPQAARQGVEARIAEIGVLLAGVGIPATDIDVRDVRREMRKGAAAGLAEYELKCGVHVKVTDLAKWKSVVAPLLAMANLDGFLIGFDSSRREQIETELTAQALAQARRRAEAIAAGVGRKLGLVSAVSTGELKNVTRAVGLGGMQNVTYRNPVKADPEREGLLMIVPMKLSQSVDVIYRFK